MGGLAGFVGDAGQGALARMLASPAASGRPASINGSSSVAVFGCHDAGIAEDRDRGDFLALVGYARIRHRAVPVADLLRRFQRDGERCLATLAGEFAIAARLGARTFVARDALGTRPLYVADTSRGALFSTSLHALIYAGVETTIDLDAVVRSLVLGFSTAPGTALASVRQLGPGEVWQLAPTRLARGWFSLRERLDTSRSLALATRRVDAAMSKAVTRAIPNGARVAAFLSGGLDSSLVLARLVESGTKVDAFTLSFGAHLPGEMRYARAVAQHLGVQQHIVELDARRFSDAIPHAVRALEDLVSETITVPNYLLAAEAAKVADVVFTGEGGDQSFGGPKNVGMALAYAYQTHPAAPPLSHTWLSLFPYFWGDLERALQPGVLADFDTEALANDVGTRFWGSSRGTRGSFVGRVMVANTVIKGGHYILLKAAKVIGAAHDIAVRSPMYDRDLVELAVTIPPWQKADGTDEKLVLRRAALRSLPKWVVHRPKRGMMVPLGYWFARDLGVLAHDVLTQSAVQSRGLFRWPYIDGLLAQTPASRARGRGRALDELWLVLMTELHHRAIEEAAREARSTRDRAVTLARAAHA
jgi:asparagine synthase (glutamine-hydrolysing)